MSSENPAWASKPLTVVLNLPGPQALLRFAPNSRRAGNDGPRKVASKDAPGGVSLGIEIPTDPAIPFGTESAPRDTSSTAPSTRYCKVARGSARERQVAASESRNSTASALPGLKANMSLAGEE